MIAVGVPALPAEFRLFTYPRIDSTNAEAVRRIGAGSARAGDVIVAAEQAAGRGRRGNPWHSPGGNLHVTLVVDAPCAVQVGQIAFVAALAVGEAVAAVLPPAVELRYKWPNDLLLGGRKVAGILIEGAGEAREQLAVGIGVNVAAAPEGMAVPATSLHAEGAAAATDDLVGPLCAAFARWQAGWKAEGFGPVRDAWLSRAFGLGEPIEARLADGTAYRGVFRDLDPDGALVIESSAGVRRPIAAGEIFFAAA